ncbi:MAG: VWA domain-containing protein [Trueperaceae bacterium]
MPVVRWSKHEATLDDLDGADLMRMLQDRLLSSGFDDDPFAPDPDGGRTLQELYEAIAEALFREGLLPESAVDEAMRLTDWLDGELGRIVRDMTDRLVRDGFVRPEGGEGSSEGGVGEGPGAGGGSDARFELTGKATDLLGHRSLREVLGGDGGRSFGAHRTRERHAGIEAVEESRPYRYGDAMNLDLSATFGAAMLRGGDGPLRLEEPDLHVQQSERTTTASTVVMLDCSHSMILYGEDRFTPAKQVALALAHLIRTEYPGDTVRFVLFHDGAEEIPLARLAQARVGPYHTNTAMGLQTARRLLRRDGGEMKQIVMITDGKPSAITLPNGKLYKNAYGLDRLVLSVTLGEVAACRREGIGISTFMLAREPDLIAFVRRVASMTRGKAYFTTPRTVGRYVLQDFAARRTRTLS